MDKLLLDYIGDIVELEKSIYTQTQSIEKLSKEISNMAIPHEYIYPKQACRASMDLDFDSVWGSIVFGAVLGGVIGIFAGSLIGGAILGAIGLPMFIIVTSIFSAWKENRDRDNNYRYQVAQYQNAVAEDKARVNIEEKQRNELQQVLKLMINKRDETMRLLDKYYSLNIIYHKYRSMVAMCSIYEYLISGICPELTGYDGAYNKFDHDSMIGIIIAKLDEVINNLDQIKNNQYMLFDAIQEGNRISQGLLDASVRQVQLQEKTAINTEIAAYYQQQTACEANQIKNLMLYESWNKHI